MILKGVGERYETYNNFRKYSHDIVYRFVSLFGIDGEKIMYIEKYDYGARVLMTPADKEHFIEVIKMLYTIDCKNMVCTKDCPCHYVCGETAQNLDNMLRYVKEI